MNITKITIGRLYNLGNYEHIRYELTCEIKDGESATEAVTGMERIIEDLKPLRNCGISTDAELDRRSAEIKRMKEMPYVEWQRQYGHCTGTPGDVIERYEKSLDEDTEKANAVKKRAWEARRMFDDLGGAAKWKDAKLDWEDYHNDDEDDR